MLRPRAAARRGRGIPAAPMVVATREIPITPAMSTLKTTVVEGRAKDAPIDAPRAVATVFVIICGSRLRGSRASMSRFAPRDPDRETMRDHAQQTPCADRTPADT